MRVQLRCDTCRATAWTRGEEDLDTNAVTFDDPDGTDWEDGNSDTCEHGGEVTILDVSYDDED